jgi:hypothetical protein
MTPNQAEPLEFYLNTPTPVEHPLYPGRFINNPTEWRNWRTWQVSIDRLESLTRLDLLTNVPEAIQRVLEARVSNFGATTSRGSTSDLGPDSEGNNIFSPLLAEFSINNSEREFRVVNHSTMGQSGIQETGIIIGAGTLDSTSIQEDRIFQLGSSHFSLQKNSIGEIGTGQVSSRQIGQSEIGASQVSPGQISVVQTGIFHVSSTHVSSIQIGSSKVSLPQISPTQVDAAQVSTDRLITIPWSTANILSTQINPTEISLTSSISLQQFLGSHNYSLQNTTVPTWLSFLTGTTPFNLNIAVTDLPTGQLAVACWR